MRLFFEELLIGFDFKNFLIALAVLFIVYLAWESTYVRDHRVQPNAVLIIENNRRLLVDIGVTSPRELRSGTVWNLEEVQPGNNANDRPSVAQEEVVPQETRNAESSRTTENSAVQIPEPPPSLEVVIEEVHDLASVRQQLNENAYRTLESFEEGISGLLEDNEIGPQRVIEAMDTTEGIRRRRLAFYNQESNANADNGTSTRANTSLVEEDENSADLRINTENCSNENNENEKKSQGDENVVKNDLTENVNADNSQAHSVDKKDEIRIKLKYLNDDMKMVKGSPDENIGDFKKRNFTVEMDAQKFVRLVFNGHVLQPDSKTLQACGLFDNCVVHCLVHNRNPNAANQNQHSGRSSIGQGNVSNAELSTGNANPSDNEGLTIGNFSNHESNNGHRMVRYAGIALTTLSIILCWYCRIQYHLFFSWYSTLVLILVTILFSILGPLLVFIENNDVQQTT